MAWSCFREEFKVEVKQPGTETITLENEVLKAEFDSVRGLLKVQITPFHLDFCLCFIQIP